MEILYRDKVKYMIKIDTHVPITIVACTDYLDEKESTQLISHYSYLLSTTNIVSLSYEEDDTGRNVLSIGVIDLKAPNNELQMIIYEVSSQKWVKVPVQIFQEGVIKALSGPCKGGCKICTQGLNNSGTLGVNIEYNGQYRLLTCAHVLTEHKDTNIGKDIFVVDEGDYEPIASVESHVPVTVYNSKDVPYPVRSTQDLAWATISQQRGSPLVKEIGNVCGIRHPYQKEMVQYYGAVSLGLQDNIPVKSTSVAVAVKVPTSEGDKWTFYERVIKLDIRYATVNKGDSGSAIVAQSDKTVVGILMSASESNAYACKLL